MYTSFICEHTAEYILVPQLLRLLSSKYQKVTPLYYWGSREGGKMSAASFGNQLVKVIAMYPRRPKVKQVREGIIQVKFNQVLFDRSNFLFGMDIPLIIGLPLADSLESFHFLTPVVWFKLNSDGSEESCVLKDTDIGSFSSQNVSILNNEEILSLVEIRAGTISWQEAIQKIKEMRREQSRGISSWFGIAGDSYKPVYFLIHV